MSGAEPAGGRPVAIVIGALAPYTHVLYEKLAAEIDRPLHVLACSARETSRHWELPSARGYRFEVLPGLRWHRSTVKNLYVNPGVALRLRALKPGAVILNDFAPTMLMAALTARGHDIPYGIRTDGVAETDPGRRSRPHRLMRRLIVPGAAFGIGASAGSAELLAAYGLGSERIRVSPLFPAWEPDGPAPDGGARPYDVLFCGVLNEEVKGAGFFTETVLGALDRGRRLSVRVVGDGPLRGWMAERFAAAGIEARFDGYLQQAELGAAYGSARLFLFPTRGDVWGIVVNEALQSGTVVVASPHSGAARELLAPRGCGLVLPPDISAWIDGTLQLLDDPARQAGLREAGRRAIGDHSAARAVLAYREALSPFLDRPVRAGAGS